MLKSNPFYVHKKSTNLTLNPKSMPLPQKGNVRNEQTQAQKLAEGERIGPEEL